MCDETEGYNLNEKSYNRHWARFLQNINLLTGFISVTMWIRIFSSFIINFANRTKHCSFSKATGDLRDFLFQENSFSVN